MRDFYEPYEYIVVVLLQAASTTCYVATHPRLENVSGKYFADCNETWTSKLGFDSIEASKLWTASEIMVSAAHPGAVFFIHLAPYYTCIQIYPVFKKKFGF